MLNLVKSKSTLSRSFDDFNDLNVVVLLSVVSISLNSFNVINLFLIVFACSPVSECILLVVHSLIEEDVTFNLI